MAEIGLEALHTAVHSGPDLENSPFSSVARLQGPWDIANCCLVWQSDGPVEIVND